MHLQRQCFWLVVCSVVALFGDDLPPRIIPKTPTPSNDDVKIVLYTNGVVNDERPIYLKTRSFPLGVRAQSEELKGFRTNPKGSTILILLNGQSRIYVTTKDDYPLIEERTYFNKRLAKAIPKEVGKELPPGKVTAHAIAMNSFDESIKQSDATSIIVIDYLVSSGDDTKWANELAKPYVLYNQPYGKYRPNRPILLDFYLYNVQLSKNGYHIKVSIDGKAVAELDQWVPYEIEGLSSGTHKVQIDLVDAKGRVIANPFGAQEEVITILK